MASIDARKAPKLREPVARGDASDRGVCGGPRQGTMRRVEPQFEQQGCRGTAEGLNTAQVQSPLPGAYRKAEVGDVRGIIKVCLETSENRSCDPSATMQGFNDFG